MPPRSNASQSRRTSSTLSGSIPWTGNYPFGGPLDVVHRRAGRLRLALRHVCDREPRQRRPHAFGDVAPRLAHLARAGADLALEQLDDLEDRHGLRAPRKGVTPLYSPLALQHAAAAQGDEERLEDLRRDVAPPGDVTDRHRP